MTAVVDLVNECNRFEWLIKRRFRRQRSATPRVSVLELTTNCHRHRLGTTAIRIKHRHLRFAHMHGEGLHQRHRIIWAATRFGNSIRLTPRNKQFLCFF
ncbi:hypothetical protein CY34DRAFT_800922 [Suillus luteus UH-Slu-Lm8-n1]|uniref:Unplaced genomic scaffold CY34scaffold_33, whole genome shotgun sequence n=1 Tax=Suillus luteus UH-Slu-Lm8-n1 TaxID=930992 RepID=A0A0D0B8D0_9AGAM|nr:hypothetical protein CY34DRAFT_800922 [Suillus luteus UH-Slu-Lm8-n1]